MYGERERCIVYFGGETCRKRPIGRTRHRWEYNIKMHLQEEGWGGGMDWIYLA